MPISAEDFEATMLGTEDEITPPQQQAPTEQQVENTPAPAPETPETTNTPEATPSPAAAPVNIDDELVRITGGAIKGTSELPTFLENARKAAELEAQLAQAQQELGSLKTKADENPFANDLTKKLNDFYKAGASESQIQAFLEINKVDVDKLSPVEASTLALQVKHGISAADALEYIADKYGIDPANLSEADKKSMIALTIDSKADREYLATHKAQVSTVPENQAERNQQMLAQQQAERVQRLEPIAKTVLTDVLNGSFKGVSLNGKEGEGAIKTDLPISEESKGVLAEAVKNYIGAMSDLSPDQKGQEAIKTFSDNVLVLNNWRNWLADVAAKTESRIRAEYNNPSAISRGQEAPQGSKSKEQERTEGILETLGF